MRYFSAIAVLLACLSPGVNAGDCEGYDTVFNNNFSISKRSDKQVVVVSKGAAKARWQVSVGDTFEPLSDHHSTTYYQLISLNKDSAKIGFSSRFDARSFGGAVTECKGVIVVQFTRV